MKKILNYYLVSYNKDVYIKRRCYKEGTVRKEESFWKLKINS